MVETRNEGSESLIRSHTDDDSLQRHAEEIVGSEPLITDLKAANPSGRQTEAVGDAPRYRWLVLAAYCLLPTVQNTSYMAYSTIVQHTADFYHVSTDAVLFLTNLANIVLLPACVHLALLETIAHVGKKLFHC